MEIKITDLKKSYRNHSIIDIAKLTIPSKQITAIVGPNGAGKSTLLNLIANLIEADSGTIVYNEAMQVPLKKMTLVFQNPYLIQGSVRYNLAYPLVIRKVSRVQIEQSIYAVAKELNIEHLLDKKSKNLSLGEKQKVALARALIINPDLLLLDEPCASIDPYTTSEIEKILLKYKEEKQMTIVLVTHNLAQAKRIADVVTLIHHGKMIEQATTEKFFLSPKEEVTYKFLKGDIIL